MSEIADVLAAIEALAARGERMALATIVAVRGSTYRRPGARLLVPEDGAPIGNLSGGCLEGDVADMARVVMQEGRARLAGWDLTADDDAVWGLGLGCNGAIDVFIEPADRAAEAAGALRMALQEERPISLVTVLESDEPAVVPGARLVVGPEGSVDGSLGAAGIDTLGILAAREQLAAERSEIRSLGAAVHAFVEVLEPPLHLVICGAGHDAIPLVRAAAGLGWNAVVVDDREAFLSPERFPDAAEFVHLQDPTHVAKAARVDERTHLRRPRRRHFERRCAPRGGRDSRSDQGARTLCRDPVAAEGVAIDDEVRARIHGPAGLDLGAEGPEEIAQAIVAEIVAVKRRRSGGFLKERPGPIHDRPRPGTEAR